MPCVVITGGPGSGKTTLLAELARRGYTVVSESARAIIAGRLAAGLSPRPDPLSFAEEIQRRDVEKYELHRNRPDWVFFDRCVLEAVGMIHEAKAMTPIELQAATERHSFHAAVFVLPPWQEIYTTDSERDQTYVDAVRVHAAIVSWYDARGYQISTVPPSTVEQRANHVIAALEHSAV